LGESASCLLQIASTASGKQFVKGKAVGLSGTPLRFGT